MFGTSGIQFDQDTNITFTLDQSHGSYQSSLWVAQDPLKDNGYTNIARLFYETQPSDNGSADEWKGSFGSAVTSDNGSITQTFTFLQNQIYALLLWSDTGTGQPLERYASSSTFMNSPDWFAANTQFRRDDCVVAGCQQAVFGDFKVDYNSNDSFTNINGGKGPEQYSLLTMAQLAQGTKISFDDAGGNDRDFQDFSVLAQLGPEPVTLLRMAKLAQGTKISFDDAGGKNDADFQDFTISAELVPEPITVFGTILGIGALAAARGKKKRQQQPEK
jgi:hypothetical protein